PYRGSGSTASPPPGTTGAGQAFSSTTLRHSARSEAEMRNLAAPKRKSRPAKEGGGGGLVRPISRFRVYGSASARNDGGGFSHCARPPPPLTPSPSSFTNTATAPGLTSKRAGVSVSNSPSASTGIGRRVVTSSAAQR